MTARAHEFLPPTISDVFSKYTIPNNLVPVLAALASYAYIVEQQFRMGAELHVFGLHSNRELVDWHAGLVLAWGHTIYGKVDGNMKLQLIRNGNEEAINPSGDILYTFPGNPTDDGLHQNLTIKVLEAANDARLTVNRAFINGSAFAAGYWPAEEWTLASNDGALKYTGFVQQQATAGLGSPTTYVSSTAGDKMSMQFNGSAVTIYGPCGPSSGLMHVNIDGQQDTINMTKPFQSDDCLLYQSPGIPASSIHTLEIDNVDGRTLAVNRLEFDRVLIVGNARTQVATLAGAKIAGIVVGVIVGVAALIILYSSRSSKSRKKFNKSFKVFCG
ncbi:unnamed protein product [Rhizoctonia solani]|uniref:Uncharacterized protein n=1 Tax=Rhizoctonia solani TaxID=456999 RepID=A0A8H3CV66_9AGAM|nr:unnamed protein product [Rhizoctonia solani]